MLSKASDYRFTDTSKFTDGKNLFGEVYLPFTPYSMAQRPALPFSSRHGGQNNLFYNPIDRAEELLFLIEFLRERIYWASSGRKAIPLECDKDNPPKGYGDMSFIDTENLFVSGSKILVQAEGGDWVAVDRNVYVVRSTCRTLIPRSENAATKVTSSPDEPKFLPLAMLKSGSDWWGLKLGFMTPKMWTSADALRAALVECVETYDYTASDYISPTRDAQILFKLESLRGCFQDYVGKMGQMVIAGPELQDDLEFSDRYISYDPRTGSFGTEGEGALSDDVYGLMADGPNYRAHGKKSIPSRQDFLKNVTCGYNCYVLAYASVRIYMDAHGSDVTPHRQYLTVVLPCNEGDASIIDYDKLVRIFAEYYGFSGNLEEDLVAYSRVPASPEYVVNEFRITNIRAQVVLTAKGRDTNPTWFKTTYRQNASY